MAKKENKQTLTKDKQATVGGKQGNANKMQTATEGISPNDLVEVVFILDRSGSMAGLEADTIGGFNATLARQKALPGEALWTTVLFDHTYEVIHDRLPITEVPDLTPNEYYANGTTALLDAIGRTIDNIDIFRRYCRPAIIPQRTLFVITTDGMENSSHKYTYSEVKEMIEERTQEFGWEFIFLGANMDAVKVAGRMGIRAQNAATFINDDMGIEMNFQTVNETVTAFRECGCVQYEALDEIRKDYKSRFAGNKMKE